MSDESHDGISRRQAIATGVAVAAGAGVAGVLLQRGGSDSPPASDGGAGGSATTASGGGSGGAVPDCVLAPEQTEGPYYIDNGLVRSDIRDGVDGVPLDLRLQVVAADECRPIEGATVEVWHCDARGTYSGVDGDSANFCRGGQRTAADGWARFETIYPGWYQGRTTHIHVKVHVGGNEVHTGQLYFPDETSAAVHGGREPYRDRGEQDTPNSADGIYGQGGAESTLRIARRGDGYLARLALGVNT